MDVKQHAVRIVAGLKKAGIDFVATLPDEKMVEVIRTVEGDPGLKHIPLCREEEGIGICAGAYLAGKKTALIMQNAGFLNSCNALTTTCPSIPDPDFALDLLCRRHGRPWFHNSGLGDRTGIASPGDSLRYLAQGRRDRRNPLWRADSGGGLKKPVAVLLTKTVLGVK